MTIVCGIWSLSYIFSVVLAGGVGKNGSTVAVSFNTLINRKIANLIVLLFWLIVFYSKKRNSLNKPLFSLRVSFFLPYFSLFNLTMFWYFISKFLSKSNS